ncbi:MAG: DUF1015 family protein [Methanoregula sp.]|nr:DUF1015 family protein [Methanoregula sp.]
MVRIYRFAGVRPARSAAGAIAAVPYDVVSADEVRAIIAKNPGSFLRVSRSDAELPELAPDDDRVYQRAHDNFKALESDGRMRKDPAPAMYLYRVLQDGETFLGLCCCLDVDDYRQNRIRRHEQTRYDKEEDRTRHIEAVKAHNGPVVLLYRNNGDIFSYIESLVNPSPDAEVISDTGIIHQIFRITDQNVLDRLEAHFLSIPSLYIADGHHRAKAALNVVDRRIAAGKPAGGEVSRFMGVMFAHDRVKIHGYSRLIKDLGVYTPESFLTGLKKCFDIKNYGQVDGSGYNITPHIQSPDNYHVFHMYLSGHWYECTRPVDSAASPLSNLDVAILQEQVLEPMLGIADPRGDARLQYLGGARPVSDLEKLVDSGKFRVAFAMQPVGIDTVLSIADVNGVMPPKSTWFEPKLLSGLVVHTFG